MSQPPAYTVQTDFSTDESNNASGRSTVRTANLDTEFTAIATTLAAVLVNLSLNQRDDGQIRDQRVTVASLSTAVVALFTAIGVTVRGTWVTATAYAAKDIVIQNTNTYICATAHTSGTFATDLAAVKWVLLAIGAGGGSFGGIPVTGITDLTTTGNTILGDAITDTLNIGNGGFIKNNANEFGVNATPVTGVALRVQSAGSNDVGLEFQRTSASRMDVVSYNRNGAGYTSVRHDAADHSWSISGVLKLTLDSSGNLFPATGKIGPNAAQQHTLPAIASDTFALLAAAQTLTNKTLTTTTVSGTGLVMSNVAQAGLTTLDWYEEGTFTPVVTFGGASVGVTYGANRGGRFVRIGQWVHFNLRVVLTNKGSSTGSFKVGGLPYSFDGSSVSREAVCSVDYLTLTGLTGAVFGIMLDTNASVLLMQTGAASSVALTDAAATNTSDINISGTYLAL